MDFAVESEKSEIIDGLSFKRSGRPKAKGDWAAALSSWDEDKPYKEHFKGLNPGFQRDKTYRLEAKGALNLERTNAAAVMEMLTFALKYLHVAWERRND